jgi:ATP adenylyltransferase
MDILHAYWRMDYVTSPEVAPGAHANPFVALPQLGDDRAALIVRRATYCYVVLNRYPYNPGHLLVVPYAEIAQLADLPQAARAELMELLVEAQDVLTRGMQPDGFNIGFNLGRQAGAGIPQHLHAHIVPRWNGDTNFLPVIGKTRTLPQALDATWHLLHSLWHA